MCLVGAVEVQMMGHQVLVVDQFQGFVVDHSMVAEVVVALPIGKVRIKRFFD